MGVGDDGKENTGFFPDGFFFGCFRHGCALFTLVAPWVRLEWDILLFLMVSKPLSIYQFPFPPLPPLSSNMTPSRSHVFSSSQEKNRISLLVSYPYPKRNPLPNLPSKAKPNPSYYRPSCTQILLVFSIALIMWDTYFHQTLRDAMIDKAQQWLADQVNAMHSRNAPINSPKSTDEEDGKCSSHFDQAVSTIQNKLDNGQHVFTADEVRLHLNTTQDLLARNLILEAEIRAKHQGTLS